MNFSDIISTIGTWVSSFANSVGSTVKSATRKVLGTNYGFQLTAKIMPYSTCFSHSVANLLSSVGINITPDEITTLANSQEYQDWVRQNVKWAVAYIGRLQTVWQVQERVIQQILEKNGKTHLYQVVMNWNTTRETILENLNKGFPTVIDTYPVYYKTGQKLGHIIAVVGYAYGYIPQAEDFQTSAQFNEYVEKFGYEPRDCYIIDDPFGNMLSGYIGNERIPNPIVGDDLIIPFDWFDSNVRGKFSLTLRRK